jgi:colanic acid/amylovoran biosynthesis protein
VLAGAPLDTGNRGVEALGCSVVDALEQHAEDGGLAHSLTVLDNGWGVRPDTSGRWQNAIVERVGARRSRRWHRQESWLRVQVDQAFGSRTNPVARRIAKADAVLDISGGDSFTDLYGEVRLASVSAPKDAALRAGAPLVLLPQTYGPFTTASGRRRARAIVRAAALAYSRDSLSYGRLLDLAGADADITRCREGVDVAFALQPRRPHLAADLAALLDDDTVITAGVNVSGLLLHAASRERFDLVGDYLTTMTALVRRLVSDGVYVVFVPHVHVAGGQGESDIAAIYTLREGMTSKERERTVVLPPDFDAAELKWCISRLSWMTGSRMHSTIGSLSSRVPTFGYAYSDKTRGVFDTCGVGDEVGDARKIAGEDAVSMMLASFARRAQTGATLTRTIPAVVEQARGELREIFDAVVGWRSGALPGTIG